MHTNIALGEKLKQVRMAKGLAQDSIAHALKCSIGTVSRIESGQLACDAERLTQIKKVLEIENAPLFEHELAVYRSRLLLWNSIIADERLDEAKSHQEELSSILALPFEQNLRMLYLVIEARLLAMALSEEGLRAAESNLDEVEACLSDVCADTVHIYHRNRGGCYAQRADPINAIKHYSLAVELEGTNIKTDATLLSILGAAYLYNAQPIRAISYLERANGMHSNITDTKGIRVYLILAALYISVTEYDVAKKLSEAILISSRSRKNDFFTAQALNMLGIINLRTGNFDEAITLLDEALGIAAGKWPPSEYAFILYNKADCMLEMKKFSKCTELIQQGKNLLKDIKPSIDIMNIETPAILFETMGHLMTLSKAGSCDYIENVTIPHFRNTQNYSAALNICDKLEAHYLKKGANKKANNIIAVSRDIYRDIFKSRETQTFA